MARADFDADAIFQQVMAQPAVKAKLMQKASRIATLARKDMVRAKIDGSVTIKQRHLSTGRASLDVQCSVKPEDERRAGRIMRRAGRGGR
ncbi:hypothetical protein [Corynebacterium pseudopelargi]|uniref:Uncharacterized protein n=1 Tax=Corynebacterium pseudopelargi TaxID=2080757 RepID=A0A3G6IX54_9CORY|nr:hypothetical protein [Corynebacterium pseudopelargi]AZA08700.1 hypothetical protein CPPEL_02845 [Corynebacterium pseudopelargi]